MRPTLPEADDSQIERGVLVVPEKKAKPDWQWRQRTSRGYAQGIRR
jgi:hypothetical protein